MHIPAAKWVNLESKPLRFSGARRAIKLLLLENMYNKLRTAKTTSRSEEACK